MQGLYVVTGREGRSVVHAATRMPLLDLAMRKGVEGEAWGDPQGPTPFPTSTPSLEPSPAPAQAPQPTPTHTEGRTLGGGVLAQVRAVDSVPLHQLIRRGVGPEVVRSLHLGVLQGTGPHCGAHGGWESRAPGGPPSHLPPPPPPVGHPFHRFSPPAGEYAPRSS